MLALLFGLLALLNSAQAEVSNKCHFVLAWGHGADVIPYSRRMSENDQNVIPQGCYVGSRGNIRGRIPQKGFNGVFQEVDETQNGGMNPKEFEWFRSDYPNREKAMMAASAIGFMRLTRANWAAVLMAGAQKLSTGECSQVKVSFDCVRTKDSGIGTREYKFRLGRAQKARLYDYEGNKITFSTRV